MNIKDIKKEIEGGESQYLEFKQSVEKGIANEVAAFANAKGGKIIIGVNDKGEICGTDTSNRERGRLENILSKIDPRINFQMDVIENIIVLTIPEGKNKLYLTSDGFYMRIGTLAQKLNRNEIINFLQADEVLTFDNATNYEAKYPKSFSINAYNKYLKLAGIKQTKTREDTLLNLSTLAKGDDEKLYLTNAGVLLFAKNPTSILQHAYVVCALYKGFDKTNVLDKKDIQTNLIETIEEAMTFLKRHLNVRYDISSLQRNEIYDIPEAALREVLINAVCHRDYFETGAQVLVEIFDDRVVISNPGGLPRGLSKDKFGKMSVARNPIVAALLYRANFIEKMGTGISRINSSMLEAALPSAEFAFDSSFMVTLYRDSYLNSSVDDVNISATGQKILDVLKQNSSLTIAEISSTLKISESTTSRELKKLRDDKVIFRIGANKSGYWRVREVV